MRLSEAFVAIAQLGSEWVLWLLVALSVTSLASVLERGWYFWKHRASSDEMARQVFQLLRTGDLTKARAAMQRFDVPECVVLGAGMSQADHGPPAAHEAMQAASQREVGRLERNLCILAIIGSVAPLVGLMGALIAAAAAVLAAGAARPEEVGLSQPVATAMAESLVAAALSLFVALPALVSLKIFRECVRVRSAQIEALVHLTLSQLHAMERAQETPEIPTEPIAKAA